MSNPNYSLEVISHLPQFKSKSLRKYYVDGIETVGAWGDEPFEIKFTNHTWQKLQVKISLDGTDIFTGKPATTEATKDMWVVQGYGTLSLKAWPETNNGGAGFVFTSANNSVALHTHGDLSSRGIIAAAVYIEGHVEPIRINNFNEYWYTNTFPNITLNGSGNYHLSSQDQMFGSSVGGTYTTNSVSNTIAPTANRERRSLDGSKELQSLVSVGAGQHVDQKITYVAGLIKPTFTESVRVRYIWWDDLVSKLKEANVPAPQPSGFPGDRNYRHINLGSTPRQGVVHRVEQPVTQSYLRL